MQLGENLHGTVGNISCLYRGAIYCAVYVIANFTMQIYCILHSMLQKRVLHTSVQLTLVVIVNSTYKLIN